MKPLKFATLLAFTLSMLTAPAWASETQGPYFDASRDTLFIPLAGTPEDVRIAQVRGLVTIDCQGVDSPYAEMNGRIDDSPLVHAFWTRVIPSTRRMHLTVSGPVALEASVERVGEGLLVRLAPKYSTVPAREAVRQVVTIVPRNGGPIRTYDPEAEPPVPPPPLSTSAAGALAWPTVTMTYGSLSEAYTPEDLSAVVPEVASLQAVGALKAAGLSVPFRIGRRGYAFEDPDYPEVFHSHVDTSVSAAIARSFDLPGADVALGIGYQGLFTQVTSTTAPPTDPAPSRFFFAGDQSLQGPFLYHRLDLLPMGPLSASLELNLGYLTLAARDMPPVRALAGWRIEPSVRVWPGLTVGYFWEGIAGAAFNRQSSGFMLGFSFSGPR